MTAGFAAVPNWIIEDETFTAHEMLVYLVLSSKIGDQGAWFIGHSEISRMSGVSVSSVQRALRSLAERGIVSWVERINEETGARMGNSYRIEVDRLGQREPPPRSEGRTPPVRVTEQNKNPEKEPIKTPPTPSPQPDDAFDRVWAGWPNKSGKKPALSAWRKAQDAYCREPMTSKEGTEVRTLVSLALEHAAAHRQHTPSQYVPMLATWLNQERWTDPLPRPRPQQGGNARPTKTLPEGVHPNDAWMYS